MGKGFWIGLVVGVAGTWGYHAFLKRLPSKNG